MPSVKFPINVNLESIDGDVDRGKIVNGYAEVASQNEVKVYSRPALNLAQGSFAAFGQGIANTPDGQVFVISGGEIYIPVPSQTVSALSTYGEGPGGYLVRNGNHLFMLEYTSNFRVYRSAPPFTSWSTVGTWGTAGPLLSVISHQGTMVAFAGSASPVRVSANGSSWSSMSNSPSNVTGALITSGARIFAVPATVDQGTGVVDFTDNFGASTWGTVSIGTSGVNAGLLPVYHLGNIWTIRNDAVGYSADNGASWTSAGTSGPSYFAVSPNPLSHKGFMWVAAEGTGATTPISLWASQAGRFTQVGTAALGTLSSNRASIAEYGGSPYLNYQDNDQNARLFKAESGGDLNDATVLSSISIPQGEVATIVGTEDGITFVKSTVSAYTIESGVVTRVSDAQYPAITVRGAVYLNGRLYVMEPDGTIWNSAEDDFTSWASTDFVTAEFEADGGVCLAKQGEYVIAFGQFTTEAFYDAGNPTGSPLSPVGSAVMLIGSAHENSVAQVETSLVWVAQQKGQGSTFHKGRFVAFMKGYGAYDRISTPDVERVLDADAFTEVYADILTIAGHVFYVLTLVDTDITLVYDFRTQLWYQWSLLTQGSAVSVSALTQTSGIATATATAHGFSDGDQVTIAGAGQAGYNLTVNVNRVDANTFTYPVAAGTVSPATGTITATGWTEGALDISASCYFDNSQLVQLRETGDVYVLDVTGTSDNGAPIDFRVRTRLWDAGTGREKFQNGLEVQGDKVSSTGLVRYWNEDFTTPTKYKRVDLSLRRPRSKRGGSFSRRAVEFRHTLSAKVGISALEADIELGEQ